MSRIKEVLRQKKDIEQQRVRDRKQKLEIIKVEAIYKAKLLEDIRVLNDLFDNDPELEYIIIEIPEKNLTMFNRLMYTELDEFRVSQAKGKANLFEIRRRLINY